jgi:hypothetical protein
MDIRAKTVLDLVKSVKGAEHAVIAGGAIRDMLHNVPNKDVDIFIPHKSLTDVKREIIKLDKNVVPKTEEYETAINEYSRSKSKVSSSKRYLDSLKFDHKFEAYGFEFEGVKFDLITSSYPNEEDFGDNVIEDFDYGLNMAYYDGLFVKDEHPEFKSDQRSGYMTLRKVESINDLPKMIGRYNSISERFFAAQHWRPTFKCTALTVKKAKVAKKKPGEVGLEDLVEVAEEDWANPAAEILGGVRRGAQMVNEVVGMPAPWDRREAAPVEQVQGWAQNEVDLNAGLRRLRERMDGQVAGNAARPIMVDFPFPNEEPDNAPDDF